MSVQPKEPAPVRAAIPLRRALLLALVLSVGIAVLPFAPAAAVPSPGQITAERAALEHATERYDEAQAAAAETDARTQEASAELDRIVAEEQRCLTLLATRAAAMYRFGDGGTLMLLLSASNLVELTERFDLLERMARQDAENLRALKVARAEAEQSAAAMLELQVEQARALDALAAEVATARSELAASEAELKEYEARIAAAARAAAVAVATQRAAPQNLTGTGEWRTAVASHYSPNFTGRGANGEPIGPYTMMVAHKTLPFGTLVEFEYNGRYAVAKVADRGPYVAGREFDLGPGVVRVLNFNGVHEVRYRIISQ